MVTDFHNVFLSLVRLGVGTDNSDRQVSFSDVDWGAARTLAAKQGLSAIVMDGIEQFFSKNDEPKLEIPKPIRREWIGEVLQDYEDRFHYYEKAIGEMVGFYNHHGFKMMILKGYACALDWPRPDHRPCGDIDIWQFGQQKEADSVLAKQKGVAIDSSHHHHTVFSWRGFMVENHYDFINIYSRKSNKKLEDSFKELGMDDSHYVEMKGEKVYLPSANLHSLFLIRHAVAHFSSTELNLRQVLDWAFFVKAHSQEVDWEWLLDILERYHMKEFLSCLDAICVEDLGFDSILFPQLQVEPSLKARVLNDILSPEFTEEEPKGLIPRVLFKYRRWQANAWKQRLCFNESRWGAFWSSVWAHILKPSSI